MFAAFMKPSLVCMLGGVALLAESIMAAWFHLVSLLKASLESFA
jgi:hypothetical protein